VDLKSLSLGERIAAVSGAALFLFMFVPWLEGRTAWELFSLLHVLLALVALTAVALPLIKATAPDSPLRVSIGTVLSRAGLVALTITATFLIEGADRNVGIFLAVLAAAGILYGGMTTPDEAAEGTRGRRRERERPRREYSSEEFEEPPPGMEDWRPGARSWGPEEFEEEPASARAGGGSPARRERGVDPEPEEPERRRGRERPEGEPTEVREPRRRRDPDPPEAS